MRGDKFMDVMWAEALAAAERAERLHRHVFSPDPAPRRHACWAPPMDVFEGPDGFVVQIVLPDVNPAHIECVLVNHMLVISAERPRPPTPHGMKIRRMEIPRGRLERRIPIAAYAITHRSIANGCLTLVLAK